MKPRLLILSDLWGQQKASWIPAYLEQLQSHFDIQYYDCCILAGLDLQVYTEAALHHQFVTGGITRAVNALLALEKETKPLHVLAFSVGGTIAWRANLKGLKVINFYGLSATRLRYEVTRPSSTIYLYFGSEDVYSPSKVWLNQMGIAYQLIEQQGHTCYTEAPVIHMICSKILSSVGVGL